MLEKEKMSFLKILEDAGKEWTETKDIKDYNKLIEMFIYNECIIKKCMKFIQQ